jgi:hypothetical protein
MKFLHIVSATGHYLCRKACGIIIVERQYSYWKMKQMHIDLNTVTEAVYINIPGRKARIPRNNRPYT